MDNLFFLLFLASIVALIIGVIKPSLFAKYFKKHAIRKDLSIFFSISALVSLFLLGVTTEPITQIPTVVLKQEKPIDTEVNKNTEEQKIIPTEPVKKLETIKEKALPKALVILMPEKELPIEASVQVQKTDREKILTILKANASSEWGTDYRMVKYEYDNQVEAYDWVTAQTGYANIMKRAKSEWGTDYGMVKYEYNNQVENYKWIESQTEHLDIMSRAKQEWGTDYGMVKYEYTNQVDAYSSL